MRLYTFTHTMLSPIAKGIQSGHATTELFVKYGDPKLPESVPISEVKKFLMLSDWTRDHKTHIALDGGNSKSLQEIVETLDEICDYPWADFTEDDETLAGIRTSVAVVIPKKVYRTAELLRNGKISERDYGYHLETKDEKEIFLLKEELESFIISQKDRILIRLLNKFRLLGV